MSCAISDELLQREIAAGWQVVLDLSGLEFMDCSGLQAILVAAREARRAGAELKRTAVLPKLVHRLLELADVDLPVSRD